MNSIRLLNLFAIKSIFTSSFVKIRINILDSIFYNSYISLKIIISKDNFILSTLDYNI